MEVQILENRESYQKLRKTSKQLQFINDLADFLCSIFEHNIYAMRGFILRSFKIWQVKVQKDINSIIGLTSAEGFRIWTQLCSIIFSELTKHVIQGEVEWELECLLGEGFTLYQAQFCID